MSAFLVEVARDLVKALVIGAAMAGLAASGMLWWLNETEAGQAVTATVELVQTISVEVQQANGGLAETLALLNENLRLARQYYEQEIAR